MNTFMDRVNAIVQNNQASMDQDVSYPDAGIGALENVANNVPRQADLMNQPHMLAYINPQEEQMLRDMGGAGHGESWRLTDAALYVTLEPCTMCCGAILLSRVGTVVFGAADPRAGAVVSTGRLLDGNPYRHQVEVVGGISATDCGAVLSEFFQSRRD